MSITCAPRHLAAADDFISDMHPHWERWALGVNYKHGSLISLRLLTDDLDGLRLYSDVVRNIARSASDHLQRETLCHELAHNVHMHHKLSFKQLNSSLVKSVATYYARERKLGRRCDESDDDVENQRGMGWIELCGVCSGSFVAHRADAIRVVLFYAFWTLAGRFGYRRGQQGRRMQCGRFDD